MDAPGRWSWRFDASGGNIHHRFAVIGGHGPYDGDVPMDMQQLGRELPVFLDTVRDELGLPEVWQSRTLVSAVGPVGYDVLDSGTQSTILRLRQSDDDVRVGLGPSGQPLFYDLRLPLSVPDAQAAAVPTRLIVSHAGRMQLVLPAPRPNAITSVLWSADPTLRGVTYQHFVVEKAAGAGRVQSLMTWQCGNPTRATTTQAMATPAGGRTSTAIPLIPHHRRPTPAGAVREAGRRRHRSSSSATFTSAPAALLCLTQAGFSIVRVTTPAAWPATSRSPPSASAPLNMYWSIKRWYAAFRRCNPSLTRCRCPAYQVMPTALVTALLVRTLIPLAATTATALRSI
jgi:hypothetical protein